MAQSILNINPSQAFNGVLVLITIQAIVTSAEYLSIPDIFEKSGLLSWEINRLGYSKKLLFGKCKSVFVFLENINFKAVLILRIFLALVILILLPTTYPVILPLVFLSIVTLFMTIRSSKSNNGADQMASIVILSLAIGKLFSTNFSNSITLLFIAAQASLAYGTSGFLKLTKAGWRNGSYIIGILKTSTFGNKRILQFIETPRSRSVLLANMVIYGDIILSLTFLFPPQLCAILLCAGVFLHVGIGIVMGLNTFIWSFCATYPAIYYISCNLYHNL